MRSATACGGGGGRIRSRLADIWHVVAVAYLAAVFLVWASAVEGGFAYMGAASAWTVAAVAAARLADLGVLRLVEAATRWEIRADSRFPGVKARADRYVPVLRKSLRTAVWLIAAVAALEAWRAPVLDLLAAPLGERIIGALVRIALVLGVFLVLWEALCLAIERYLDARDEDGNPVERSGRARTLLPLLRRASAVLLLTVGGLTAASELGIDIAPLLAGVGIAGLAIGFGAQTLVKDVITGPVHRHGGPGGGRRICVACGPCRHRRGQCRSARSGSGTCRAPSMSCRSARSARSRT